MTSLKIISIRLPVCRKCISGAAQAFIVRVAVLADYDCDSLRPMESNAKGRRRIVVKQVDRKPFDAHCVEERCGRAREVDKRVLEVEIGGKFVKPKPGRSGCDKRSVVATTDQFRYWFDVGNPRRRIVGATAGSDLR
jgi:hypothetical protein